SHRRRATPERRPGTYLRDLLQLRAHAVDQVELGLSVRQQPRLQHPTRPSERLRGAHAHAVLVHMNARQIQDHAALAVRYPRSKKGRTTTMRRWAAAVALLATLNGSAFAETPEEWIALGARVHGGFGSFIPLGIKIGLDALERLKVKPRDVTVVYYD